MKKIVKRLFKKPNWYNLKNLGPISRVFGFDRGVTINKKYMMNFQIDHCMTYQL